MNHSKKPWLEEKDLKVMSFNVKTTSSLTPSVDSTSCAALMLARDEGERAASNVPYSLRETSKGYHESG